MVDAFTKIYSIHKSIGFKPSGSSNFFSLHFVWIALFFYRGSSTTFFSRLLPQWVSWWKSCRVSEEVEIYMFTRSVPQFI